MYLDYWGLKKHAFHNVPDPSMYFEMHESVENAVGEVLFAIEEGDECLAVIVGDVGLGKTMALRVILDSLDTRRYKIAFITNPDLTFPQLLREIIGQLHGTPCTIKAKDALLETFNRILIECRNNGQKVVIFIDEGNAIRKINLESLRLLTNMQDDDQNLFTLILAGQPELARKLEHPRLTNLFQRIGVYCKLSKLKSRDLLKDYIEHRLERAGASRQIFTEDAIDRIWEHSEHGVPRLVNRICKLAMKAGETNHLSVINGEVIDAIAARFIRTTKVAAPRPLTEEKNSTQTLENKPGPVKQLFDEVLDKFKKHKVKEKNHKYEDLALIRKIREDETEEKVTVVNESDLVKPKAMTKVINNGLDDEYEVEEHNKEIIDRMKERYRNQDDIGVFYR
ncbi:MAG: hypothetical protein D6813_07115 [Calditrichaeota bacterium]|nr:MAG: hypothetical protein D6813_07115 [Calditrichota bacterium]